MRNSLSVSASRPLRFASGRARDVEGCGKAKAECAVSREIVELPLACIAQTGALFFRQRVQFCRERGGAQQAPSVGCVPCAIGHDVEGILALDDKAALAKDAVD